MRDAQGVEWLTPAEAADRLGIPRAVIRLWLHRGVDIRTHRAGRYVAVCWSDVLDAEWAWRNRRGGHPRHAG